MSLELSEPNITLRAFDAYVRQERHALVPSCASKDVLEFLAVSNALGGEAGELQNIVKKIITQNVFLSESELHDKFVLEAGDVLHYLLSLIQLAGYRVEYVMACNVRKLTERKQAHEETPTVLPTIAPQH